MGHTTNVQACSCSKCDKDVRIELDYLGNWLGYGLFDANPELAQIIDDYSRECFCFSKSLRSVYARFSELLFSEDHSRCGGSETGGSAHG